MKTIASSGFEPPILRRRYRQSSLTWSVCVQSPQRHRLAVGMRPTRNFTEFRGHRAQTTIGLPRRLALLTCMGSPYPLIRRSGIVCSDGAKLTVAAPRVVVEFWRRSAHRSYRERRRHQARWTPEWMGRPTTLHQPSVESNTVNLPLYMKRYLDSVVSANQE